MRKVMIKMIKWLFSFILLALGAIACASLAVNAGDIAHNFMSY